MLATRDFEVCFGGPDQPPGRLRDVLAERIAGVPPGGTIDWVTYYFRDRRLAEELLSARRRGVEVRVTVEGKPRVSSANDRVLAMLAGADGLGEGLRVMALPGLPAPPGRAWKPQFHEKLYCFSHPKPVAFIGSFNPSGDEPEDRPDIIREIGDQDRGHNMLVGLTDKNLVDALVRHARRLNRRPAGLFYRFSDSANRTFNGGTTQIHFWPRLRPHPVAQLLSRVGAGGRVRIAASHIRSRSAVNVIAGMARRGAAVNILAEHTTRRVPGWVEERLILAGAGFRRVTHPDRVPMHFKLVLVESDGRRCAAFGSFNWTRPSWWLNHEIAAVSSDEALFEVLSDRFEALKTQAHE